MRTVRTMGTVADMHASAADLYEGEQFENVDVLVDR